jgi:hypothetical protein
MVVRGWVTFSIIESSTRGEGAFFDVATTIPFVAIGRRGTWLG